MMIKRTVLIFFISLLVYNVRAQQPMGISSVTSSSSQEGVSRIHRASEHPNEAPRALEFNQGATTVSGLMANLNEYLGISDEFTFIEISTNTDDLGMRHHHLQQYYKGIALDGLTYRVHERNGFVTSANGKAIRQVKLNMTSNISEEEAFAIAVNHLKTIDTTFRSGKRLIVSKDYTFNPESFALAYQFDIEVSLIERWRISINATNGEVVNKLSLVKESYMQPMDEQDTTKGLTNYYGIKTIRVLKYGNSSRLSGVTNNNGKIETYDFERTNVLALTLLAQTFKPQLYYSYRNTYNSPYDQPAVSTQWAMEQVYEYFHRRFNRNSFDNNGATIKSYVHVDKDLDNAFWTGKVMAFGDGSNNNPLVELDVIGHEYTHAITDAEADLNYSKESGAINESFSDIFAKAVEFDVFGDTATWMLARHHTSGGFRNMRNPKLKGHPNTYKGEFWYDGTEDYGGVHTNSGVQNYWFYLLCEGGSGINDQGESYSIEPIGMELAINIAYRNLSEYLIPTSDYLDSRIGSLLATADLYGKHSTAYQEVDKAWDAVGVIDEPIITSLKVFDITATTVKIGANLQPRADTATYHFEYDTTQAFGNSTPEYGYADTITASISDLQSDSKYYLKLVATNANGVTIATTEFTTISLSPLVIIKNAVDVTDVSAVLRGQVNPNSLPTSYYFEYGPSPTMGLTTATFTLPDSTKFLDVSVPVSNLDPRNTYFYKLVATNTFSSTSTDSVSFFTATKPSIISFTPMTATVGTEMTIVGENFNAIPEKNWVFFGATKGTVLSSSNTEIKVKVPAGASFGPISVMDEESGLVTESIQEFMPTYDGEFVKGSLQLRATFDDLAFYKAFIKDMDNDGRPDIVTSHYDGITILQNVNDGGQINGASFMRSNLPIQGFSFIGVADLDGNGLKDLIGYYNRELRVYPNQSVPGYMFFGAPIVLSTGYLWDVKFCDFDNDGKIDISGIAKMDGDSSLIIIYRNQNPGGSISAQNFEMQYSRILPYSYIENLDAKDVNGDGKIDLIPSQRNTEYFTVLINHSEPGEFEFDLFEQPHLYEEVSRRYIAIDIDHNGYKDVFCHPIYEPGKLVVFEHSGAGSDFLNPITILDKSIVKSVDQGDIDGDGRLDILLGDYDGRFIFLKNKLEEGAHISDSSFELHEHYGLNENGNQKVTSYILLNDLNGDGRPEVINNLDYSFGPFVGHQLEIWQNVPNECFDPSQISVETFVGSANIILPAGTTLQQFRIQYKREDQKDWKQVNNTSLTGLTKGATYQLRARGVCRLGQTSYYYINFKSECVDASSFEIIEIQPDYAKVSATNLEQLQVQYSLAGEDRWWTISLYSDKMVNLQPGSVYNVRYRGQCTVPTEYEYTQFTTLCPKIKLGVYNVSEHQAYITWSSNYGTDMLVEYSSDKLNWIEIVSTNYISPLVPGTKYYVRGRLNCNDVNSDFVTKTFTTPCPKVSSIDVTSLTPYVATIEWEDESNVDSYTVSYSTSNGEATTVVTNSKLFTLEGLNPGTSCTVSVAPECVGDKDFKSKTFMSVCQVPFNLKADSITCTSARLSWQDEYGGVPYIIDYSLAGSNVWNTIESASPSLSLAGLRPGTLYEARVHITCQDMIAQYTQIQFSTKLYEKTSIVPNPAKHFATIYPSKSLIGNQYGLYDNMGKMVSEGTLSNYTLDLTGLRVGVYILKIEGEEPLKIMKR